jgi:hypothetical protein
MITVMKYDSRLQHRTKIYITGIREKIKNREEK